MLRFSTRYSDEIASLLHRLKVTPVPQPIQGVRRFVPDFHISATITKEEMIGDCISTLSTPDGKSNGFSVDFGGKRIELSSEAWKETLKIVEKILKSPDYRETVSQETLHSLVFDWLKETYKNEQNLTPMEFISQRCEEKIRDFEVWIPIAETYVEGELHFGRVTFKEVSKRMMDVYEEKSVEVMAGTRPGLDEASLREHALRLRKTYQGKAAATLRIRAEPVRAYEVAEREAGYSIALLRSINFFNAFHHMTLYAVPLGQENVPGFKRFLMEGDLVTLWSEGSSALHVRDFKLDKRHVERLRQQFGLDRLHSLLVKTNRSNFEEDVFSALLLYSRSVLRQNTGERLTIILASLEFILMDNSVDPQEMGERLAMINERDTTGRKEIVQNTKTIYRLRSRLIRGESDIGDLEILDQFLTTAWVFFINLVATADRFSTRREFAEHIENWKLSGGLQ